MTNTMDICIKSSLALYFTHLKWWVNKLLIFASLVLTVNCAKAANPPLHGDSSLAIEFRSQCGDVKPRPDSCVQFVRGVRAGLTAQRMFMYMWLTRKNIPIESEVKKLLAIEQFCLPPGITDEKLTEVAISYIDANAGDEAADKAGAGFMVMMAIAKNFICSLEDYEAAVRSNSKTQ